MTCPSKIHVGENLVFGICTHDPDTGILTDADVAPAYRIYENENPVVVAVGNMARLDNPHTTGFYTELVACTIANGFRYERTYTIYIEATVGGDTGGIAYAFRIPKIFDFIGIPRIGVSPLEVDFHILA
jgi:hypothetical protein